MPEELETILRLVAEGHLTPEEAAPIIEALSGPRRPGERSDPGDEGFDEGFGDAFDERFDAGFDRFGDRLGRRIGRRLERAHAQAEAARARAEEGLAAARLGMAAGGGRQLRIKVTERGRQVVNLRIPIGFVDTALRFVPGLGDQQRAGIRDAVRSGAVGPILDVEDPDGEGGVLISVE